mmetsp:Transcript_12676/g.54435  ORF Transcript_12676/g.54435 Transcript_12676/m.54435 type:complete len:272 (-) Transcript_12676:1193-2008(-)
MWQDDAGSPVPHRRRVGQREGRDDHVHAAEANIGRHRERARGQREGREHRSRERRIPDQARDQGQRGLRADVLHQRRVVAQAHQPRRGQDAGVAFSHRHRRAPRARPLCRLSHHRTSGRPCQAQAPAARADVRDGSRGSVQRLLRRVPRHKGPGIHPPGGGLPPGGHSQFGRIRRRRRGRRGPRLCPRRHGGPGLARGSGRAGCGHARVSGGNRRILRFPSGHGPRGGRRRWLRRAGPGRRRSRPDGRHRADGRGGERAARGGVAARRHGR